MQVWLGDLGRISDSAQQHWRRYNIADDDGVPASRIEQDLKAQFVEPPPTEPLDRLRGTVQRCNEATMRYCGQPLYAEIEGLSADRVQTLRVPLNRSLPAFQDQVTTLAIMVSEHLNADFLKFAGAAPRASSRWSQRSLMSLPESATEIEPPATTTSYSQRRMEVISMAPLCVASSLRRSVPGYARSVSMTYGTRLGRWRSAAPSRSVAARHHGRGRPAFRSFRRCGSMPGTSAT